MAIAVDENCKMVSISSKRQITIPQVFFNALSFKTEAECILKNGELIIRPVHEKEDSLFSEQILEELITEGYSGEELLSEFKTRKGKIRPAVVRILQEAKKAAKSDCGFTTTDELFGD